MQPDRSELVAEIVEAALERDPAERPAFLDEACRAAPELRAEVDSLLVFQKQARDFIERPAYENATQFILGEIGELRIGQSLGDYKIVSLLAEGGMGEVYLAQDTALNRRVAIKLIKAGLGTASIIRHFRNEQRILAGLNHPNIAQLYDAAITADGLPYFVMEYIEGARIDDYCRDNKLSLRERLTLFLKVCAAVGFAHRHLIIHRDLKPGNIRVTPEGEPKLLDFGIAKLLDPATAAVAEQTMTLQALMTPDYASPEQVRGETMTTASDVYSLGVVLYELFTGQRPYSLTSRRPDEIARAITAQEPTRPSTAIKDRESADSRITNHDSRALRGDLDNIVLKAIRKEPERRYQSVRQFSEDIERHLRGLPVIARKDTLGYRMAKLVARNRIAVSAAAVVALAIIAGLIIALWQADKAREQRDMARRERAKAERINQFLQRMLSFSNQSMSSLSAVAQKKNVTVNEMLDQIAPQIETELADQPEVRAQVLRTIGSAYASQGRFDLAEKNLRTAFEIQERLYGQNHAETVATMVQLAGLAGQKLKFKQAADLLQKCVAFYRERERLKAPDFKPANLAEALDGLATARLYQGEPEPARILYNEALRLAKKANLRGAERSLLAAIQRDLGGALVRGGDPKRGEDLLRQSLALDREIFQKPRWETGATLTLLGELLNQNNRPAEAEKYLKEGDEVYRATLGNENLFLSYNLYQQALAFSYMKNYEQAEAKARESVAMSEKVMGNDLNTGAGKGTLGIVLTELGRAREGETQLRRAIEITEKQSPKNPLLLVETKMGLSQCLLAQNRLDEAEAVALEACNDARQSFNGENPIRKSAVDNLNQIHKKQSRQAAAQPEKAP